MIWVRLIGGVKNGQVVKVDDGQVEQWEQASFPLPRRGGVTIGSMSAEIKRTRYTRREVATPEGAITFFADADMSDFSALNSVLGP